MAKPIESGGIFEEQHEKHRQRIQPAYRPYARSSASHC